MKERAGELFHLVTWEKAAVVLFGIVGTLISLGLYIIKAEISNLRHTMDGLNATNYAIKEQLIRNESRSENVIFRLQRLEERMGKIDHK